MGLFGPSRRELQEVQQALAQVRAERQQLGEELAKAEARAAALASERDGLVQACDTALAERDDAAVQRDELVRVRDAATAEFHELVQARDTARTERDAARAEADELRRQLVTPAAGSATDPGTEGVGDGVTGSWSLVLAELERRWAAGVGALPEARGVVDGPVPAQLAEGLTREVERLREEMGVDVSLTTGDPIEPADPVVFVLATTGMLGALAATCERVSVVLDEQVILTGQVWAELGDDLEVARARALAAGAQVDPIDVDDDRVRVTLRP